MTRAAAGALVAVALTAGVALRLVRLDVRPMHHDEANQAVKFGALLERGEYRYDAHDHHGPTLYYLSLPAAWLRGQRTLASLDEHTLRGVTAAFGAATILLLPLTAAGIGRTAATTSALLMALSPAMVFYSRMFIQESLFACFTLLFVIAAGHAVTHGRLAWFTIAGIAAGLAVATKETSIIVLPAALLACAFASWSVGSDLPRNRPAGRQWWVAVLLSLTTATAVAALFYSSFLTAPAGVLEPFRAAATYLDRGVDPASHVHPWHYYLRLITYSSSGGVTWSEGSVVLLAVLGIAAAVRPLRQSTYEAYRSAPSKRPDRTRRRFWARYFTGFVAITVAIFSAIPYKTPWNLLPFHVAIVVLAGIGFSRLVHWGPSRLLRGALVVGFIAAAAHLAWQAWRASVVYASDSRNPYVYAQTVPDAVRMANRVRDLATVHPAGIRMQVSVIAPAYEQWPMPWYLRSMPNVGYWTAPGEALALQAPVIVASMDHAEVLDAELGNRYVSEFFGLRPDVLMTLYVDRSLWDRFMAGVAADASTGIGAKGSEIVEGPRHAASTLWRASEVR